MANFEDMTGWREELYAHWETEDFKKQRQAEFKKHLTDPEPLPKLALSSVIEFMNLLTGNDECVAAIRAEQEWFKQNPSTYPDEDEEGYPQDAAALIADFKAWYRFKKNKQFRTRALDTAAQAVARVLESNLPAADSKETIDFLRKYGAQNIKFGDRI